MRAILVSLLVLLVGPPALAQEPSSSIKPVTPSSAPFVLSAPEMTRPRVSSEMRARWNRGRALFAVGGVTGLLGAGLTISSVLVVAVTGYPCNPNDPIHNINDRCNRNGPNYDPPNPTDAAPLLAYLGSSVSALGFIFSAAGLGYQHHLLRQLGADPHRGLFHGGTTLGVLGFVSVGTSYFFGLTDFLGPHDQGVAILASTVTGAALCALGSLLYAIDSSRTKKAWLGVSF